MNWIDGSRNAKPGNPPNYLSSCGIPTRRNKHLIFFGVPHLFNQWRGEAQSRGEREIREEVSFQASEGSRKKPTSQQRA
jgi:hypothetical protein